jgi:Zn finger protein HypA/HybF involved in hydrogenase expression
VRGQIKGKVKLCKECNEPMEDQASRYRICGECQLDRDIEKEELQEARRKA